MPSLLRSPYAAVAAVAAAYLVVGFSIENQYYQLMITLMLLWTVMGLSWNTLSGYSGMISFGHASFWGLGAYTVTLALVKFDLTPWLGIPLGIAVGTLGALIIGYPTFRLRGHYFALAMLAYPLALLYIFEYLGYQEVPLPMKREQPVLYMQFASQRTYILLSVVLLVLAMLISLRVERSRFGLSLLAIKQNEPAAEAAGINSLRWKLLAIMLSGAFGSAAGGMYALVLLVVTPPTVFGVLVSAQALVLALFGGVGTLWGPVIGGAILVPLAETLHGELGHILPGIQGVVYGMAIILVILMAPEGLYWRVRDWLVASGRIQPRAALGIGADATLRPAQRITVTPAAAAETPNSNGQPLLEVRNLSRSFGGLQALQDIDFSIAAGRLQGVIGPNGSGKTTLFNVLNGFLRPNHGEILFKGGSLVGLKPNQVCRLGIGRTFQVVRTFPRMSVLQNAMVGAFVAARSDREAQGLAMDALDRVGLVERADVLAGVLTNKERRLMELARALASRPHLVLLDETLAGLSHHETNDLLEVLQKLNKQGLTIVIIEHTMHAMVRLADDFIVLDHGRKVTQGKPEQVTREPQVIEAYLGKRWMDRVEN
ncbi:MAG: branched-chain amino acid ABC transporter ATP-binding protein/permease [Candidatus Lambdaproteobacteria bacterium]|nr:branched-chain amino acid ABC transporter ATP-binding protein/permease [Candidatus Lambdaproteobacteria bacterium]